MHSVKSPLLAFVLSFFLPGVGLWYLGRWGWGLVNLVVLLAVAFAFQRVLARPSGEGLWLGWLRITFIVLGVGSGAVAASVARRVNRERYPDLRR